ncbi:MAG: BCCT family transporter, partial [Lachnospiraceae bacterium]|nr:BCCT family transporter [Lachnospiraceae bacterium]
MEENMKKCKRIRWGVFFPAWILMIGIIALDFLNKDLFVEIINALTAWILENFTWGFCILSFICVLVVAVTFFSPLGRMKVGGNGCKPMVSYRNYIWIILCTIMAAGIMLWACAEPMYHIYQPPEPIKAGSEDAIRWAMNTMFLEWTFTPMCIYCIPTLLFSFVFYNMDLPFSIGSMLIPLTGGKYVKRLSPIIDSICLFSLCAGMSASLGQGVLLLSGGIEDYSSGVLKSGAMLWCICAAVIVIMFVISASTGVTRGIRVLSNVNITLYAFVGIAVFFFGPTLFILNFGVEGIGN